MKEKYKLCNFERNTIKMQRKVNKRRGKRNTIKRTVRSVQNNKIKKRKLNKKKVAAVIGLLLMIILLIRKGTKHNKAVEATTEISSEDINNAEKIQTSTVVDNKTSGQLVDTQKNKIDDWKLILANYENLLPEDFSVKVSNIDETRQFDSRAIGELNDMMNAMKKDGITNVWIQSAYRSVSRQKELYDSSVKKYLQQGKTKEEAEKLTDEYINKPGSSDHNLGLAVDFNYVDNKFEKLDGFKWLKKNAEDYGFVLRYPKDKEDITKIAYESWHWRYVGVEHAKKMNELNMCLEEYVEYLSK